MLTLCCVQWKRGPQTKTNKRRRRTPFTEEMIPRLASKKEMLIFFG
jgi:hypothetical protein